MMNLYLYLLFYRRRKIRMETLSSSSSVSLDSSTSSVEIVTKPKKKKSKKSKKSKRKQRKDLLHHLDDFDEIIHEYETIIVDPETSDSSSESSKNDEPLSVFTILPDEIYYKICENLSERGIGRMRRVCKRWNIIAQESWVWEPKVAQWNINGQHVDQNNKNMDTYIDLFQQHERNERERLLQFERDRVRMKNERKLAKSSGILKKYFYNRHVYDKSVFFSFLLWNLIVPLKLDGYIPVSWHIINIPLYYFCIASLVCGIALDVFYHRFSTRIDPTSETVLHLYIEVGKFRIILYWILCAFLCFIIALSEYLDNRWNVPTWCLLLPWIWICSASVISNLTGCGMAQNVFRSYECCERFFAVNLFVAAVIFTVFMIHAKLFWAEMSWWVALIPIWIILCVMVIMLQFFGVFFCCIEPERELFKLYGVLSLLLLPVIAWFFLLCYNLNFYESTGIYALPWLITWVPIYVANVGLIIGFIFVENLINS
eukprot:TRINITY_DN4723_c0_g1_i1.p1 TRINITY_DN4723_c0_g1~~TRINITY_DN4723_c0_g1_i1.p1  ORF type:complete len:485 (+),score=62.62 TRINITY_DN4723_c0_g1_i1:267-1721(+)